MFNCSDHCPVSTREKLLSGQRGLWGAVQGHSLGCPVFMWNRMAITAGWLELWRSEFIRLIFTTFYCSNIKFTILIIFKCAIWCTFTVLCNHHTIHFQNFFIIPKKTLYSLSNNSVPHSLVNFINFLPMNLPVLVLHISGVIQCLSFCVWLTSLGLSLRCIHVVAYIRISFLF